MWAEFIELPSEKFHRPYNLEFAVIFGPSPVLGDELHSSRIGIGCRLNIKTQTLKDDCSPFQDMIVIKDALKTTVVTITTSDKSFAQEVVEWPMLVLNLTHSSKWIAKIVLANSLFEDMDCCKAVVSKREPTPPTPSTSACTSAKYVPISRY